MRERERERERECVKVAPIVENMSKLVLGDLGMWREDL
jgi:hypothetical protein